MYSVYTARNVRDFNRERSKVISSMGDSENVSSVDAAICKEHWASEHIHHVYVYVHHVYVCVYTRYTLQCIYMYCIHVLYNYVQSCIYIYRICTVMYIVYIHVHIYTVPSVSEAASKSQEHCQNHLSETQYLT